MWGLRMVPLLSLPLSLPPKPVPVGMYITHEIKLVKHICIMIHITFTLHFTLHNLPNLLYTDKNEIYIPFLTKFFKIIDIHTKLKDLLECHNVFLTTNISTKQDYFKVLLSHPRQ